MRLNVCPGDEISPFSFVITNQEKGSGWDGNTEDFTLLPVSPPLPIPNPLLFSNKFSSCLMQFAFATSLPRSLLFFQLRNSF